MLSSACRIHYPVIISKTVSNIAVLAMQFQRNVMPPRSDVRTSTTPSSSASAS